MSSKISSSIQHVQIYTDGACQGNPGPGGWGAILLWNQHKREIFGGEVDTTNNRMEMMAVIESLRILKRRCQVTLFTDSKYVQNGITTWIHNWKRNNWRTSAKKPVKNVDLWQELDRLNSIHDVTWNWVKGHSGDVWNEHVDRLARKSIPSVEN